MKCKRRIVLCILFLLCLTALRAQEEKKDTACFTPVKKTLVNLTDGVVSTVRETGRTIRKVGKKFNAIDTTFISPNLYNLAFMLEHSTWLEHYRLGIHDDANRQSLNFAPNASFKLGVYFGWRWIFLGYTFDVGGLFGSNKSKKKKTEMALNIYSSKFGVDLFYRKTGSDFKLRSTDGFNLTLPLHDTDFDGLQSHIFGLNTYWIFNHKRFSYPAAYSQSTNQRRSAGSFMAGFSYSRHKISFDPDRLPDEVRINLKDDLLFRKIKYSDYSLSIGYGYNWVFAKNCLANLSLTPAIAYKKAKTDDTPNKHNHWMEDLNFDLITRAGVVYNNSKYFAGASLVTHTYDYRKKTFSLTNSFATLRVYVGFNFWKKNEYRGK